MQSNQSGQKWTGTSNYNISNSDLRSNVEQFDEFVIVGTKQGKPIVASTVDRDRARQLLRDHAPELSPQSAS